jgi:hypothetical protein
MSISRYIVVAEQTLPVRAESATHRRLFNQDNQPALLSSIDHSSWCSPLLLSEGPLCDRLVSTCLNRQHLESLLPGAEGIDEF